MIQCLLRGAHDKRLVVEYSSLFAYLSPSGQSMFIRIRTTVGGNDAVHKLTILQREDYGVLKQFDAGHVVKIYADSTRPVSVHLNDALTR